MGNYHSAENRVIVRVGKRIMSVLGVETNRKLDLWGALLKRKLA